MIEDFLNALFGPSDTPREAADPQTMFAALLVRAARVDNAYDQDEIAMIDRILVDRYDLSPADAARVRAEAETVEAATGDTVQITQAIKHSVPYEDRLAVVEALWRVVLADTHRDAQENAYLRLVVSLLGVRDVDSGKARQRAAGQA